MKPHCACMDCSEGSEQGPYAIEPVPGDAATPPAGAAIQSVPASKAAMATAVIRPLMTNPPILDGGHSEALQARPQPRFAGDRAVDLVPAPRGEAQAIEDLNAEFRSVPNRTAVLRW